MIFPRQGSPNTSPLPLCAIPQPAQPVQGTGTDTVDGAGVAAERLVEIEDSVPLRIDDHAEVVDDVTGLNWLGMGGPGCDR